MKKTAPPWLGYIFYMSLAALALSVAPLHAQKTSKVTEAYFNSIRDNEAKLTAFFTQMPKGGDLHHHYSGSIYGETYLEEALEKGCWINLKTLDLSRDSAQDGPWTRLSALKEDGTFDLYKQKLLERWSVKDYNGLGRPQDKHFFESFEYFGVAKGRFEEANLKAYQNGLQELKNRALRENVSYIETMLTKQRCGQALSDLGAYNALLWQHQADEAKIAQILDTLYQAVLARGVSECALKHAQLVKKLHEQSKMDEPDQSFTLRYQNYVVRLVDPVEAFGQMVMSFISANSTELIVGVNIAAPEDNDVSMRDYALHMQMFKFCKSKYPQVELSLHAGELVMGMVKPEDLTWHIASAVDVAGASRIGHGVDIAHEKESYRILDLMSFKGIAVEINLSSNEFVLKVKDDKHPISLYRERGVPIVIATDDAGVLRTNLTEQFVLLAKRYKDIPYAEIKKYVYNSIQYSFIEEQGKKEALKKKLDRDFAVFEAQFEKKR